MEKLIRKGAEADLYLGEWYERRAIFKIRVPKNYRQPSLDAELRRFRTIHEASFLRRAREAGVTTPVVFFLNPVKAEIVMQYFDAPRLKEEIMESTPITSRLCHQVGGFVAKLHQAGIIHGDLTTSNFLIYRNRIVFLDFGLSFASNRLEDKAVDLHLMKEILASAHSEQASEVFASILAGYESVAGEQATKRLLTTAREIERRGRYARVT